MYLKGSDGPAVPSHLSEAPTMWTVIKQKIDVHGLQKELACMASKYGEDCMGNLSTWYSWLLRVNLSHYGITTRMLDHDERIFLHRVREWREILLVYASWHNGSFGDTTPFASSLKIARWQLSGILSDDILAIVRENLNSWPESDIGSCDPVFDCAHSILGFDKEAFSVIRPYTRLLLH